MAPKKPGSTADGQARQGRSALVREAMSLGPKGFEDAAKRTATAVSGDTDLEAMAVIFNLMRAQARVVQDLEAYVHRPAGTTWAAFRLMYLLRSYGQMGGQEIADILHVSASSVSSVVKTLEGYGLVTRTRISLDARLVTIELTAEGEQVVDELARRNNRREIEWVSTLSENERKTLARLLRKILMLQPEPPDTVGDRLIQTSHRSRA